MSSCAAMKLDASSKTKASFLKIQPPTTCPMIGTCLRRRQEDDSRINQD